MPDDDPAFTRRVIDALAKSRGQSGAYRPGEQRRPGLRASALDEAGELPALAALVLEDADLIEQIRRTDAAEAEVEAAKQSYRQLTGREYG